MKKAKWFATVLVVASIILCAVGCANETVVPEMVLVKGGGFPAWVDVSSIDYYEGGFIKDRTVCDFYMGKYEVTQEEYASVMTGQKVIVYGKEYELESNPSYCTKDSTEYTLFSGDVQEKRPVEGVSWYDAVWYCNALSEKEGLTKAYNIEVTEIEQAWGKTGYSIYEATVALNANATGYRLPTSAEWEYAARGGEPTVADWFYVFSGADTAEGVSYDNKKNAGLDSVGWYCYNSITGITEDFNAAGSVSGKGTHQVGKKAPNRLGLYDMSGNVGEWCYNDHWVSAPSREIRGGGWRLPADYASVFDNSVGSAPFNRFDEWGFRVVRPNSID
ncbi:MAG: formylglycine-generating enzyme family protein [Spirochaetaceae bacterium]|nr:formylglycine-generating enzyme family protein [Spirochaetaceae bacterium]